MGKRPSVLLVGDILDEAHLPPTPSQFEQDMPTANEVANLVSWLSSAGYNVDIETSVRKFADAVEYCAHQIIFPLWRAGPSRNRTAIVPAICEARALPYIGGDALVQTVCQDKSLSKAFVRAAGMKAPNELVIRAIDDIDRSHPASVLASPFVVKPQYSACSIGIDENSMCVSDEQARSKAYELFHAGLGPVICEEFISGDEVSLCLLEDHGTIIERCVAVYRDSAGRCPFHDSLLTFDAKTQLNPNWSVAEDSGLIDTRVWDAAERMLNDMGKVDLFRIDGRLQGGEFTVTELTPDIHLGIESLFLGGFNAIGKTPSSILDRLIQVAFSNQVTSPA